MDTEHTNSAVDEHMQAAGKLDRAEGSVQKALDEIQDISHGMKENIMLEKNPRTDDGKQLPSQSEMLERVERARAANSKAKCRQAEQRSDRWGPAC